MFHIDREDGRYPYPAEGKHAPGDVIERPDGSRAVYDGLVGCESGDTISPQPLVPAMTATIAAVKANTFAAGDTVYWDQSAQKGTSDAAESANGKIGNACFAKTASETEMLIVVSE